MLPIVIGRGKLYIDSSPVGNCNQVRFGPKNEVVKFNDYSTGIRRIGKTKVSYRGYSGTFQTDYITAANMALYLDGRINALVSFETVNARGSDPNPVYTFTGVTILGSGETDLVGDNYQTLQFSFEGTLLRPSIGGSLSTTTTTSTSSTTTSSTSSTTTTSSTTS